MIIVHIVLKDADEAMIFYKKVFGAKEKSRYNMPDGKIMFAGSIRGSCRYLLQIGIL